MKSPAVRSRKVKKFKTNSNTGVAKNQSEPLIERLPLVTGREDLGGQAGSATLTSAFLEKRCSTRTVFRKCMIGTAPDKPLWPSA
jgi:hypothetical protein